MFGVVENDEKKFFLNNLLPASENMIRCALQVT